MGFGGMGMGGMGMGDMDFSNFGMPGGKPGGLDDLDLDDNDGSIYLN